MELLEATLHILNYIRTYAESGEAPEGLELLLRQIDPLLHHVHSLLNEIDAEIALPPNFQHRFRTPEDSTEPAAPTFSPSPPWSPGRKSL